MIRMDQIERSQEGMERTVGRYLSRLADGGDGTFNGLIGAQLCACDYEKRTLTLRAETQKWMENPNGVVHGGVSAAMLDIAMGTLARYFSGGGMTPTVSMNVSYLHPVPVGAAIYLRAELTMLGSTLCYAGASILGPDGETVLCTASGVYFAKA